MSKPSVFCLRACALAATLLVLAVGSGSAEGRYFRLVDGELVEFDPAEEPHSGQFIRTMSGDSIEIDPDDIPIIYQLERIAVAAGGWDQLAFHGEGTHGGEGPGGTDIHIRFGGNLSPMGGYFYRVVDGALIVPEPLIPHTGFFVQTSTGHFVEIDPNLSLSEQFQEIEALVTSGAPIIGPDGENQNGPVAVEAATWGGVKAAFLQ